MTKTEFLEMINKPGNTWTEAMKDLFITCYDTGYKQGQFEHQEKAWRAELDAFNAIHKKYND